jgi:hypothetical protein
VRKVLYRGPRIPRVTVVQVQIEFSSAEGRDEDPLGPLHGFYPPLRHLPTLPEEHLFIEGSLRVKVVHRQLSGYTNLYFRITWDQLDSTGCTQISL